MKSSLFTWLFNFAARLPLAVLHRLGAGLGWATYLLSKKYAVHLRENLTLSLTSPAPRCALPRGERSEGPEANAGTKSVNERGQMDAGLADLRKVVSACIAETGKGLSELPWIWRRPLADVLDSVQNCYGLEHLQAARLRGQGVIMLTPHLGCFEVIGAYVAAQMPMTCLYRPPRLAWLDGIMREGRERGQMRLARTDIGGVRALYKALKRGEAIGLLPDQVPGNGEGEWAKFFGRPAYTMTLIGRLMEASGAAVLLSYSERLPKGAGYAIHIAPLAFTQDIPVTRQINAALEQVIRACPAQYLWSYNRYKIPAGVKLPGQGEDRK